MFFRDMFPEKAENRVNAVNAGNAGVPDKGLFENGLFPAGADGAGEGKLYRSIGEVASLLGVSVQVVRRWTGDFSDFVKPERNSRNDRIYREKDVEALRVVCNLVKVRGMSVSAARKAMRANLEAASADEKVLRILEGLRKDLCAVRDMIRRGDI